LEAVIEPLISAVTDVFQTIDEKVLFGVWHMAFMRSNTPGV